MTELGFKSIPCTDGTLEVTIVACTCDTCNGPCPLHGATYKGKAAEDILPSLY